ncbi:MAG TPA: radical SAM protein [Gemmatimonadota bacterium]|nr:radical SAM protein [Gemmatimonadota bacterium]
MQRADFFRAWGRILQGYQPSLSIEITTRCPLSCPGCYAYQPEHLAGTPLVSLADFQGAELVDGILALIDRHRPLVVHLVGGEPLVRYRELNELLPRIVERGVNVELVTSAVRRIPAEWAAIDRLSIAVSIDGLQPEHDARRKPATYDRILKHIEGHRIYVHCTVTSQMMRRTGYLEEFVRFWSGRSEVGQIRISFFTPQVGETSEEILTQAMRERAVAELDGLRGAYRKLLLTPGMLKAFLDPPRTPAECVFARVTRCISADLTTIVTPCQFGGTPDCARCGCIASMGLHAVGRHRLPGGVEVGTVFRASEKVGRATRRVRERVGAWR